MAGAADAGAGGSTVAEPLSALGAQFANPAGLARFEEREATQGLGVAYGRGVIRGSGPAAGYHAENEVLVFFPEFSLVVPRGRWTFAVSSIGTSGSRFDYGARPANGAPDVFFSESAIAGLPIGAALRVSDRLWVGAEIIPLFGQTHLRFSRPVAETGPDPLQFRFTVYGLGVQGMFGVRWKPDDRWTLGASYRPPGRLWAEGDTRFGSGKQDVELELEAPAEASFGVMRRLDSRWTVSYALRWVDASVLSSSWFRFERTPSADAPFLADARDEWRHSIGCQYRWSDALTLLGGFSQAGSIVGNRGVTPTAFDVEDYRLNAGLAWTRSVWGIDAAVGYKFAGDRRIPEADARVLPGEYRSDPAYVVGFTLRRRF